MLDYNSNSIVVDGRPQSFEGTMSPERIENLPMRDVRELFEIYPDSHYNGPFNFQMFIPMDKPEGIYPADYRNKPVLGFGEPLIDIAGHKILQVRYHPYDRVSPISTNIRDFARDFPWPHTPHENSTREELKTYWRRVDAYQTTVRNELSSNLALIKHQVDSGYMPGNLVMPIALNGGKIVGNLAQENLRIGEEQFFVAQVKRIPVIQKNKGRTIYESDPITNEKSPKKGMVIGVGGIQLPYALKKGQDLALVQGDDVIATGETMRTMKKVIQKAGGKVVSQAMTGVIGTQHAILPDFESSAVPTTILLSTAALMLAKNAYIETIDPGTGNKVFFCGDVGIIMELKSKQYGVIPPHHSFAAHMPASTLYTVEA